MMRIHTEIEKMNAGQAVSFPRYLVPLLPPLPALLLDDILVLFPLLLQISQYTRGSINLTLFSLKKTAMRLGTIPLFEQSLKIEGRAVLDYIRIKQLGH